jgi:hypothetical protein
VGLKVKISTKSFLNAINLALKLSWNGHSQKKIWSKLFSWS